MTEDSHGNSARRRPGTSAAAEDQGRFLHRDDDSPDCLDGQPCMLGQLVAGICCALILGGLGAFLHGYQSALQAVGQAVGAAAGVHALKVHKHGLLGLSLGAAVLSVASGGQRLGVAFLGASAGSLLATLLFGADLDFVLVASAMLTAVGALGAAHMADEPPWLRSDVAEDGCEDLPAEALESGLDAGGGVTSGLLPDDGDGAKAPLPLQLGMASTSGVELSPLPSVASAGVAV
eukprot:TRINITY_DN45655_c0_g1_i1.p1 TRINITY_DN45655_c0_g1~~TRINITY_DN45655_c0_g1_i1.p1  ORF type:complete len:234 (+),score=51.52 TRINITY_DN45655_c0_g1_i1:209-910(+)